MNEIKVGDIVRLKSGGPKMTVEGFRWDPVKNSFDNNQVRCTWFIKNEKLSDFFNKETLIKEE